MSIAEKLQHNREYAGLSRQDFAKKLSIPVELIEYIENPSQIPDSLLEFFASGLGISLEVFKEEKQVEDTLSKSPEPTEVIEPSESEIIENLLQTAQYPNIRQFIVDTSNCEDPIKLCNLFQNQDVSDTEKIIIHSLAMKALFHFCDTNCSNFDFDTYLFQNHLKLYEKFKTEIHTQNIDSDEKEQRIGEAQANIFCCDSIDNIAKMVMKPFAQEFENKLLGLNHDYFEDLAIPFIWDYDATRWVLEIKDQYGNIKEFYVKENKNKS